MAQFSTGFELVQTAVNVPQFASPNWVNPSNFTVDTGSANSATLSTTSSSPNTAILRGTNPNLSLPNTFYRVVSVTSRVRMELFGNVFDAVLCGITLRSVVGPFTLNTNEVNFLMQGIGFSTIWNDFIFTNSSWTGATLNKEFVESTDFGMDVTINNSGLSVSPIRAVYGELEVVYEIPPRLATLGVGT